MLEHVQDIDAVLRVLGFDLDRINGSHRIYKHRMRSCSVSYAPNEGRNRLGRGEVNNLHQKLLRLGFPFGLYPPVRRPTRENPYPSVLTMPDPEQEPETPMNEHGDTSAVPEGYKQCAKCHEVKTHAEFSHQKAARDGLQAYCKGCNAEYLRQSSIAKTSSVPEGYKRCSKCREIKVRTEFQRDSNTADGLHYHCRACRNSYYSRSGKLRAQPRTEMVAEPQPALIPATEAPAIVADEYTITDWLDLHQAGDGPSVFVTDQGFVILLVHSTSGQFEAWVLTPNGNGPRQSVPVRLIGYVVRLLAGGDHDAASKLGGRVYY